jgi:cold shock CspA family protein
LKELILEFFNTDPRFGFILSDDGGLLVYDTAPARDGRLKAGFAQCFAGLPP